MTLPDVFKALRKVGQRVVKPVYTPAARLAFYLNGVTVKRGLEVNGFIRVFVTRRGQVSIGDSFRLNSGDRHNVIGRQQKCIFWVEGRLTIGDGVGMSATAIICNHDISIGDNVLIGGNTVIYDTDFHNLDPLARHDKDADLKSAPRSPVRIGNNVFIGAHTTILKGVTIGDNAVVGACSVVTKDIPASEVWAGNPAKMIKRLS
jgi:acetyltransferase-like isoleucine patch superfamily enzyme